MKCSEENQVLTSCLAKQTLIEDGDRGPIAKNQSGPWYAEAVDRAVIRKLEKSKAL